VEVVIFGTMLYWIAWMRHDNDGGYFFWFLFTLLGIRATGSAFTQAVATAFATPEVASAFQSTAFTVFFLFAGFLIPKPLISNGWIWSAPNATSHTHAQTGRGTVMSPHPHCLIPYGCACGAVCASVCDACVSLCRMYYLSFIRYPLDFMLANEFADVTFDCSDYPSVSDCPVPIGNTILNEFGVQFDFGNRVINFISLWIFCGGFLVLGYLALNFINHIKR
jgi:hypothetical protein